MNASTTATVTSCRPSRRHPRRARWAMAWLVALALACVGLAASPAVTPVAGAATIDGQFSGGGRLLPGATTTLAVLGRGGVPASGVSAVALNVTVTAPTQATYLTVWPAGSPRPNASNLNVVANQTAPNMVIAKVGVDGKVALYNAAGTVHVVVDVLGWFPTVSTFNSLEPARLLDTRTGGDTIDGAFRQTGTLSPGESLDLVVNGRGGVPGSGVSAVALNLTGISRNAPTYLTVWPQGTERPNASNLNLQPGETRPNMVIARVGADGRVSIFTAASFTDVVVDVLGWFPSSGTFKSLSPARLLDTRAGGETVDGAFLATGPVGPGDTLELTVVDRGGVPLANVGAVAVNITAVSPTRDSFITAWPSGSARPNASNLNLVAGPSVPNMAIVKVGAGGRIALYNEAGVTDLLVDVMGWFPASGTYQSLTPARLLDTRPDGVTVPVPDDGSLLGVPLGTDAATALAALTDRLGPPSDQRDWIVACGIIPQGDTSWARWGMVTATFHRRANQPAFFSDWSIREIGGTTPIGQANIELPGGYPWRTSLSVLARDLGLALSEDYDIVGEVGTALRRPGARWELADKAGAGRPPGAVKDVHVGEYQYACE